MNRIFNNFLNFYKFSKFADLNVFKFIFSIDSNMFQKLSFVHLVCFPTFLYLISAETPQLSQSRSSPCGALTTE